MAAKGKKGTQRKLTAILCADVVGYSRLMGANEEATIETLTAYRKVFTSEIKKHRGRVVDAKGDAILAEFASVVDAVKGAVEIQRELAEQNAALPDDRRMDFRIGINLGDVVVKDDVIYGDGVNIAARLESLAEPGGVCISRPVFDQVESKLDLDCEYLGEQEVKNIPKPVRAYRIIIIPASSSIVDAEGQTGKNTGVEIDTETPKASKKPSIAVLAFENMSGDPEQEYFSDGISEDIITDLSKYSGLNVVGRNSSFAYKGQQVKLRQVCHELDVRYVLEGSVRKAGERVRITAQLIDSETGNHVWANRYDRTLADIFEVQDEITEEIVTSLDVALLEGMAQVGWRKFLKTRKARELFRAANVFFNSPSKEGNIEARPVYEQVITAEPDSPVGYQGLGWSHWYDAKYSWSKDRSESLRLAETLAETALDKADNYPAANMLLGNVFLLKGEFDQAIAAGERGETLEPTHSHVISYLANVLTYAGKPNEAVEKAQRALRLNPAQPSWYLATLAAAQYGCGEFQQVISTAGRATMEDQGEVDARAIKVAAQERLGQHAEAKAEAIEIIKIDPNFSLSTYANSQPYKEQAVLDGILAALRKAGLPE